jgi:hypothetical protein
MLPVTPQLFNRIQFGCISGERLQCQTTLLTSHELTHHLTSMRGRAVPDHQDFAWDVPQQVGQELHHLGAADGPRKQSEIEVPPRDSRHGRQQVPVEMVWQHRSLPLRRPGPATVRPLAQSAFVDEDDGLALPSGVFFNSGQRRFFQRRMACSSRSKARPTGRWQLQPSCFNSRQTWVTVYRTPHSCSIKCATRWLVHRLVAYPRTSGPSLSPCSIRFRSVADNFGLRPARPALFNPARPASSSCRAQRLTDWRWTPTRRATSDWCTPCSSNRAAFRRRCSRLLKQFASRLNPRTFPMPQTLTLYLGNVTILCKTQ